MQILNRKLKILNCNLSFLHAMLYVMSERGFVNPAIIAAVTTVVAGCTLFLFYTESATHQQALKTSTNPPSEQSSETPNFELPIYNGSTFVKKETIQNCKNLDSKHLSIPICETVQYVYKSPLAVPALKDWFAKATNIKPWECIAGHCQNNETQNQFDLDLRSTSEANVSEVVYKFTGLTNDDYTYIEGWQTVFARDHMYSYPTDWSLDDAGLKSPDYQVSTSKIVNGCIVRLQSSPDNTPDSQKKSEAFPLLGDKNATLNSWQDAATKTFHFEIKSAKLTLSMDAAKQETANKCEDVFLSYAKSYKMIVGDQLLESN